MWEKEPRENIYIEKICETCRKKLLKTEIVGAANNTSRARLPIDYPTWEKKAKSEVNRDSLAVAHPSIPRAQFTKNKP